MRVFVFGMLWFLSGSLYATSESNDRVTLLIANHEISVEVANTQYTRSKGLMFRKELAENDGMLFVFPVSGYYSMWMKNTYIPLSVAFIDEEGVILNIEDMQPETLDAHDSEGMARYALEMNIGWFLTRKIVAGTKIIGLGVLIK